MVYFIAAVCWVGGLMLAGSETPWMPWTNLFGALVFLASNLILGYKLKQHKRKNYVYFK